MKEKNLTIQGTKSLTTKSNTKKDLSLKEKNTALTKSKKKETALVETKAKKALATIDKTNQIKPKSNTKNTTTKSTNKKTTKSSNSKTNTKSSGKKATKPSTAKAATKSTVKKSTTKSSAKKAPKTTTAKSTSKKSTPKSTSKKTPKEPLAYANEYFDLPYRYNETVVKLLAQTPKRLFVYWDISDKDRENYIKTFGEDFFNNTIPFLRITNKTLNYTYDININDFANSWYININDDNSEYSIELYRKFKDLPHNASIFIATSNNIEAPNGKIISTAYPRTITYRNIKTNKISYKQIEKSSKELYNIFINENSYNPTLNANSSI